MMIARLKDRRFRESALAFFMAVGLAGCVVVISDEGIETGSEAHWEGSRDDAQLAQRVRDALDSDPLLADSQLKVAARDGVVTVRGTVEGTERLERTVAIARATQGTEKVISRLKVEVR